jgi:predicted HTH transcriptional regulator
MVDLEYGRAGGDLSATHEEYRLAQVAKLPTLVFIRGLDPKHDDAREAKTKEFIAEVKRDGYKYVRFHDREDLKPAVRSALYAVLKKEFHLEASDEESEDGKHLIEVASTFEATPMPDVSPQSLDAAALAGFVEAVIEQPEMRIWDDAPENALVTRGLAMQRPGEPGTVNRAAYLLFAPHPANRFPQAEDAAGTVPPALEAQLNDRQKDMVGRIARGEELTSRACQTRYRVSAQALHRDFQKLVSFGLVKVVGSGRSARYVQNIRG